MSSTDQELAFAITCQGLSFAYSDRAVFSDFSLRLPLRGFHALYGRSGSGKSTLAKILSGFLTGWSADELHRPARVLYAHGSERLPSWLPVATHLRQLTSADGINQLAAALGVEYLLYKRPAALSSGQHNAVNLLRYLATPADVLILDEVLANVDEPARLDMLGTLKRLTSHITVLYISHHTLEVATYCDRIFVLNSLHGAPSTSEVIEGLNANSRTAVNLLQSALVADRLLGLA